MSELKNLDALAEQLYKEGMARSEKESKKILDEAQVKHDELIRQAQKEAKAIVSQAQKEAEKHRATVESQIRQKSQQAIQELKNQIKEIIRLELLDAPVKSLMSNEAFVQELILSTLEHWKSGRDLELMIPQELEKVHQELTQKIHDLLPELTIKTNPQQVGNGFKVRDKSNGYFLSFTDQDYSALLEPHLSKAIHTIIFKSD